MLSLRLKVLSHDWSEHLNERGAICCVPMCLIKVPFDLNGLRQFSHLHMKHLEILLAFGESDTLAYISMENLGLVMISI